MRDHLIPVRMAKMNNRGNNGYWWECRERGTLLHCWWESKLVQALWRIVWRFFRELKIELPYDPEIPPLGIYPKGTNVVMWRGMCTPMFIGGMSTIAKLWKEPSCPSTNEWIKMWYRYTMEYYAAIKKWNLAICDDVVGTRGYYAKWNKSDKKEYCMISKKTPSS